MLDVLHSTVDAFRYDMVLQTGDVTRHVQLKARKKLSRTTRSKVSTQLIDQQAACVVVIECDNSIDAARARLQYRSFGGGPRDRIPELGDKVAKHSKGNAQGVNGFRERLRVVPLGRFVPVAGMPELADRLFGPAVG
jgi:hypothetical protein